MTKSELLNILYAERNRVEKQYARPGWTMWALVAAIASLGWLAWGLAEECEHWSIVIWVFYILMFSYLIYESIKLSFRQNIKVPIYVQNDLGGKVGAAMMCVLLIGLMAAQLLIIPFSFHPVLYWCSFVGIVLFLLLSGSYFLPNRDGYVPTNKNWGALVGSILYLPMLVLLIMYLCEYEYNPEAYRLGVIGFAMYYLFGLIPFGEKHKFSQIDELINRVLYEGGELDEKAILEELEVYIVGLRYGKYLSATKLKELKPLVSGLVKHSDALIQDMQSGNKVGVKAIVDAGQKIYNDTTKLYDELMSDVNGIYGDGKNTEKSLIHIVAVGKIAEEAMKFWSMVMGTMELKPNQQVLTSHISAAYKATIDKPEIVQLIEQELNDNMGEMG